jgi:hypothetical protein
MMSMNVYVNLMIVIGTSAGYMVLENVKRYNKVKKFELEE